MTTPKAPPRRYVTVSVRPETHQLLIALLHPRETMDELLRRVIYGYRLEVDHADQTNWAETRGRKTTQEV